MIHVDDKIGLEWAKLMWIVLDETTSIGLFSVLASCTTFVDLPCGTQILLTLVTPRACLLNEDIGIVLWAGKRGEIAH